MKKYTLLLLALCVMQGHAAGIGNAQQELLDKSAAVEKAKKNFEEAQRDFTPAADAHLAAIAAHVAASKANKEAVNSYDDDTEESLNRQKALEAAVNAEKATNAALAVKRKPYLAASKAYNDAREAYNDAMKALEDAGAEPAARSIPLSGPVHFL